MFWDLDARLAAYLVELDRTDGQALPTSSVLAALLGTVAELVSRKLGAFCRRGWIRPERRRLWMVDLQVIRQLQPDAKRQNAGGTRAVSFASGAEGRVGP